MDWLRLSGLLRYNKRILTSIIIGERNPSMTVDKMNILVFGAGAIRDCLDASLALQGHDLIFA